LNLLAPLSVKYVEYTFYSTDRVGGRTVGETLKAASGSDTWDLGAQYVGRYNLYCCSNSVMFCKVFYFFYAKVFG